MMCRLCLQQTIVLFRLGFYTSNEDYNSFHPDGNPSYITFRVLPTIIFTEDLNNPCGQTGRQLFLARNILNIILPANGQSQVYESPLPNLPDSDDETTMPFISLLKF